ncbi:hypothetical protein BSU00_05015 [Tenacibaculum sp. SG-28]|nr:hypothetical protein BSU00_05015 [Tenacibaculum sp. SG-28]
MFFLSQFLFSQSEGDKHRANGLLDKAISAYKIEYDIYPDNMNNSYNLACAYALTNQIDKAFKFLKISLRNDTSLWVLADNDLYTLSNDPRWKEIENQQLNKNHLKEPLYAKKLLALLRKDQVLDYQIDMAKKFYMNNGYLPHWYYALSSYKKSIGKENFEQMEKLVQKRGWPTISSVGKLAADAPLLIINHHECEAVRIKYLPQIKEACLNGEGSCVEYAKIQDRILVNTGKPQIYGMQFRFNASRKLEPFPIYEPEHVDKRRKKIGLEPLQKYLKKKIDYDWVVKKE